MNSRLMMPRTPLINTLAALVLLTNCAFGQDAGKIADIRIGNSGQIEDASKENRKLEIRHASVSADKDSAAMGSINAIIIPFANNDPLFEVGPQTWLLRIKIPDPLSAPSFCIAGRWYSGENRRSMGVLTQANEGLLQFLISTDGSGATSAGLATKDSIPANEWITFIVKYQPEARMEIQVFDDSGNQLSQRAMTANVPPAFFTDDMPFWIGAPAEVAMSFSRFAAWKRILSDSQITAEIKQQR